MSLGSFLKGLWQGIENLFSKIPVETKAAVHTAVVVTEAIDKVAENPLTVTLASLIPDGIGTEVETILQATLPKTLVELKLVDAADQSGSPDQIVAAGVAAFQALDPSVKPALLHSISLLLTQALADGKLTWSDAVYVVQWYYENMYKAQSSSDATTPTADA